MEQKEQYILKVEVPDDKPQEILIDNHLTIGKSSEAKLQLPGYSLASMQCIFREHNGILSILNSSKSQKTFLGAQQLGHGKMYILESGDIIKCGQVKITVVHKGGPKEIKKAPKPVTKPKPAAHPKPAPIVEPAPELAPVLEPISIPEPVTEQPVLEKDISPNEEIDSETEYPTNSDLILDKEIITNLEIDPHIEQEDKTTSKDDSSSTQTELYVPESDENLPRKEPTDEYVEEASGIKQLHTQLDNPKHVNFAEPTQEIIPEDPVIKKTDRSIKREQVGETSGFDDNSKEEKLLTNELTEGGLTIATELLNAGNIEKRVQKEKTVKLNFDEETTFAGSIKKERPKRKKKKSTVKRPDFKQTNYDSYSYKEYPNFLLRVFAFIVNLSLVYPFILLLTPAISIDGIILSQINNLLPLLKPYTDSITFLTDEMLQQFFYYFLNYLIMDLLSHLILKTSIPLFVLGISGNGNFLMGRIQAALRSIIGTLTFPLLILDLPALFGKPTIKELITGSRVEIKINFLKYFTVLTILPILMIASFISPIIKDKLLTQELSYMVNNIINQRSKTYSNLSTSFNYFISSEQNKIVSFKNMKDDKTNKIILKKQVSDLNFILSINLDKTIPLLEIINKAMDKNPLFAISFPSLNNFLSLNKKTNVIFDSKMQKELGQILSISLNLKISNLKENMLRYGPFINGFVETKLLLEKELKTQIKKSTQQ